MHDALDSTYLADRTLMRIRLKPAAAFAVIAVCLASCRNPTADAQIAEQLRDLGDELNGLRQDAGDTHSQLDSLRLVVARQDTLLRQLAGMAGVPVPAR
jgi:hypothetical protein